MKRIAIGLIVVAAAVFTVSQAMAGGLGAKFDQDSAHGKHAHAYVHGSLRRPRKIVAKVRARPAQSVEVHWGITCSRKKGYPLVDSRSGVVHRQTPFIQTLRFPFRRPNDCTGHADVYGHGRLKVVLYGQHR